MKRRKILVISPAPTHPQNAGNRVRIFNLSAALKELGYEVHFLLVELESGDKEAMNSYWKDNVYYYRIKKTLPVSPPLNVFKHIYYCFKYSANERKFNYHIDDWYDEQLDTFAVGLEKKEQFDIVVVEYVFLSRTLLNFGVKVLKVLDTHDVFKNRFEIYLKNNQQPQWFSTYEKEEAKALNRADVVIAIQQSEHEYFSSISKKRIIKVGHIIESCDELKKTFEKKILFVASHNPINVDGINYFIDAVLSKLRNKYPDVKLFIAGKICNQVKGSDNVILLGEFDDPRQVYQEADIVINPVRIGTGLNIKTIEALSYGKSLVATSTGTAGLEYLRDKAFLVADTDFEFVEALSHLIDDESRRQCLVKNAKEFIEKYNKNNLQELKEILNQH